MTTDRRARPIQPRDLVFYCLCLCLVAPPTAAVKAFCVQGDPSCSGGFASSGSARKELWMEEKIGGKSMTGVNSGINSSINPGLDPGQSILHRSGGSIAVGETNPTIYDQNPAKKIATWNEKDVFKSLGDDGTLCTNDPTGMNTINPC